MSINIVKKIETLLYNCTEKYNTQNSKKQIKSIFLYYFINKWSLSTIFICHLAIVLNIEFTLDELLNTGYFNIFGANILQEEHIYDQLKKYNKYTPSNIKIFIIDTIIDYYRFYKIVVSGKFVTTTHLLRYDGDINFLIKKFYINFSKFLKKMSPSILSMILCDAFNMYYDSESSLKKSYIISQLYNKLRIVSLLNYDATKIFIYHSV